MMLGLCPSPADRSGSNSVSIRKAFLRGLLAGAIVLAAGWIWSQYALRGVAQDLVIHGLAIVIAPAAAAASAASLRAGGWRVLAIAGFALLFAVVAMMLLDYAWTFALVMPRSASPLTTIEPSADEATRAAQEALLIRHVLACALGLVGGSLFGIWRASAPPPARGH